MHDAYIDSKSKYIAKDLISIYEVWKKLLQCAEFGECVLSGDLNFAIKKLQNWNLILP